MYIPSLRVDLELKIFGRHSAIRAKLVAAAAADCYSQSAQKAWRGCATPLSKQSQRHETNKILWEA